MTPTVSIVLPTYNRAHLLPRAMDSIVAQSFNDWEILLVDDGSTDTTDQVVNAYSRDLGDRLRFLRQSHTGCCAARNRGIDAARGEFVAFLDSDDEFLPNKLARQLELFRLRPELSLVYSDYSCVDLTRRRFNSVFDTKCPTGRRVSFEEVSPALCVCHDAFERLLDGYFIATITGLVRRSTLGDRIRFLPDPAYAEEWLFYAEIAKGRGVGFVNEPLSLHHFTGGSISRSDPAINTAGLRRTLLEMRRSLDPLPVAQRRALGRHLAAANRQLGYDALRSGEARMALSRFAEAFRCAPSRDSAGGVISALLSTIRPNGARLRCRRKLEATP